VQDPGESFTVHGGGKIFENPSPCTVEVILYRARWWQSFTVHGGGKCKILENGGGKCKILENPSPSTVEASARSWRILHRARWSHVQDPGESYTGHLGGKCKILANPSPCTALPKLDVELLMKFYMLSSLFPSLIHFYTTVLSPHSSLKIFFAHQTLQCRHCFTQGL